MSPAVRRLIIAVVVIVVLLVAADRIGDYVAEQKAADTIRTSQNLPSDPDVDIAGFPFLTQLATRDFDRITISADDLPLRGAGKVLQVAHLTVVLHGVTVSRSFSQVHADRADATARVTYDDLSRMVGAQVAYAGDGRVRARTSVTVAGRTVAGSVTARPQLSGTDLSFGAARIPGAGSLAGALTTALNKIFDLNVPLTDIPFKVRVQSLAATQDGIAIALTGRDLDYART